MDDTVIGESVSLLRVSRGWSQSDLARRLADQGLPFHQQTVQRVEQGVRPLRLTEGVVLASLFNMDVGELLGREIGEQADAYKAGFRDGIEAAASAVTALAE